ncbi:MULTISPECIES: hypothetical protein [unclassified Actinoplanes]|uniref:hypothetical protein n=1 Tax=unclassified Actinoplanes TaxID=2626549 RepID=UPI0002E2E0D4|nr:MULTISPECIES: hypothetical protein [unclassified Actinoplanes]
MLDSLAVRLSPSAPYPEARALLRDSDFRAADAADPQARTRLLRLYAAQAKQPVPADPADPTASAVRAFQLIEQGWNVRGGGRARTVTARQFRVFHRYLAEAERVLHAALTRTPHDLALWTASLLTVRGLEMGLDHARYRYACLSAFDPHHLPAQSQLLQQLCPKWSGSWPEAEAFVRAAMRAAPEGAHNAVLLVDYYLEKADFRGLRADIEEAAGRSVCHPAFARTVGWVQVVNSFALAFSKVGDRANARRMFTMLGPYASEYPWSTQSAEVTAAFRQARMRAFGLSGGLPGIADLLLVAAAPAVGVVRRYVTR